MQLNKNDKQQHVSVYVTKLVFAKLGKKMYYVHFIKSTFVTYSRWQISYSTNEEEETQFAQFMENAQMMSRDIAHVVDKQHFIVKEEKKAVKGGKLGRKYEIS